LDSTKNKIKSETRNLSGVYLILNKFTLDFYVGSASTNKFYAKFINHLFNLNGSKIVKAAVKKYKISEFAFIILELFPERVTKENNKILLDLEDFYLKSLLPNYNILTEAGSNFGYKHTEMIRIQMKSNYSLERRIQIGLLTKGPNLSEDTIEIIRSKALIIEKPTKSKQAILNMRQNTKGLLVYNLDYTVYGEFPSIVDAAKYLNCNEKTIRRALKTEKKLLKKR
jgi:group I intron endonuclease